MENNFLKKYFRPHLLELTPYASARDDFQGEAEVFLDANENALGSVSDVPLNRYPDPYQQQLKQKIAVLKEINRESIFLGHGSDEPIDLLIRATCEPHQDKVVICPPTYGMYGVSARIHGAEVMEVSLTSQFQLNTRALIEALHENVHARILFLCSPNNPTGNSMARQDMEQVLASWDRGIVVIDEAYIDFSKQESMLNRLSEYKHLVVLQTFSKAWGMAALRMGMAFAHPEIIQLLNKIKPPYNLSGPTQQTLDDALDREKQKNDYVNHLLALRGELEMQLNKLPLIQHIFPSDANFVLVRVADPEAVYRYLMNSGIIVRNRSNVHLCAGCLRITVGRSDENQILIEALNQYQQ